MSGSCAYTHGQENARIATTLPFNRGQTIHEQDIRTCLCSCDLDLDPMVIVWRLRGNIIRTAPCWVVWHSVHSQQHTHMSSSYRSSRLGLSHWDPYAMHRGGCLELYYCNTVEWSWWDSGFICKITWFPAVLWHCWFGHMTCKIVPDMTYNVFGGTLNLAQRSTLIYQLDLDIPKRYLHTENEHSRSRLLKDGAWDGQTARCDRRHCHAAFGSANGCSRLMHLKSRARTGHIHVDMLLLLWSGPGM